MATSGTFLFNPATSDLIINAYGRCQIRRAALTAEHLKDAAMSCNLLQVEWSLRGINLWTVELESQLLTQGTAVYNVDPTTVLIMAAYIQTTSGSPPNEQTIDRIIMPVGRDEYAAFPDKTTQSPPTVYWFDRLTSPAITVWQPPDNNGPYTLYYYRARQMQDAAITDDIKPELPYRFIEAYVSGLAVKLAQIYAPAELPRLKADAMEQWKIAADQDQENVPMMLAPMLGSYYR